MNMSSANQTIAITAALLFSVTALAATPPGNSNPANSDRQITIKITVDSKDRIMIRRKHLWIEHVEDGRKPFDIFINNRSWVPIWNGNTTEILNRFGTPLASFDNAMVTLQKVTGRGTVTLEQQPTAKNNQTIGILIYDRDAGCAVYELTINW
jgi:hypothetical protein